MAECLVSELFTKKHERFYTHILISRNMKIGEQIIVHIIMNGHIFKHKYVICFKEIVEESSHNRNTVPMKNVPQKQNMNTANQVVLCGDHTG